MTGPVPAGGRSTVLPVAGQSQLLTEFAVAGSPLLIVNISTDRAWLAGDSSVGPSSGVPLDPGTAVPWTAGGAVYAVADPAAAASITVYITSAISGWTPSPAAIAAEVAAQLLAQGIPNVFRSTVLYNATLNIGATIDLAVGQYASITVQGPPSGFGNHDITVFDIDANVALFDITAAPAGPLNSGIRPFTFPVRTGNLRFTNNGTQNENLTITGSNRPVPHDFIQRATPDADALDVANGALAGTLFIGYGNGGGPVFSEFRITGNIVKGVFQLVTGATTLAVTDTGEMRVDPGGAQVIYKNWIAPRGTWILEFVVTTTGTAQIQTRHVYAG